MTFPAPVNRFASALVMALRWIAVLVAVVISIVVVPIVELVGDLFGLLRRAFAPRP